MCLPPVVLRLVTIDHTDHHDEPEGLQKLDVSKGGGDPCHFGILSWVLRQSSQHICILGT